MTLPASGQISMSQVRTERALSGQVSLGQAEVRALFGIASGQIKLSDGWGKSYCACNCNYACTCNCNYACTCDCNYSCTCNCNYSCTCNCNYSCTCQCNYCSGDATCCPAPDVPVLMADGTEKLAGDLVVGDVIRAWDEETSTFVDDVVTVSYIATNNRMWIVLSNGRMGRFARNHKFLRGTEWVELQNLAAGDVLTNGISVIETKEDGHGPVVFITIKRVHTYVTLGVISHNYRKT